MIHTTARSETQLSVNHFNDFVVQMERRRRKGFTGKRGRPAHLVAPGRPVLPNPVPPPLSPSHVMPRVAIMGNASNGEAHCSKKKIDSRSK